MQLRLYMTRKSTEALGPYKRYAIWVQGCNKRCIGCIAPGAQPLSGGYSVSIEDLAADILSVPDIEGITISGGEPFLQQEALCELIDYVRNKRDIGVIIYTGMLYSEITNLLQQQVNGLHNDIRSVAAAQNRRLSQLANNYAKSIDELRRQREQDRAELQISLNAIKERDQSHRKQAQFWISQAEAFFADIEQYRHEMFTPNQLSRLRGHLAQVQQDMQSEAYQSAIASARSIFIQAVDLKERVVQAEIEWAHYHTQFQQAFADLRSELYYHQTMQFIIDTDAGEEHLDANIDYWSNGLLSSVSGAVEQISGLMERINDVPTAELISTLERIKELRQLLDKAREDAKDALVSSQMRAEMASTMAEHLQMAGWEFVGYTYEGSEMNAALHVKFRDNMGNEIVTVISPESHYGELCNNMQVNFFDPYNNDESMRGIWVDGILESLRDVGLNVGRPVTQPGYEVRQSDNEAIRDLDTTAMRKQNS